MGLVSARCSPVQVRFELLSKHSPQGFQGTFSAWKALVAIEVVAVCPSPTTVCRCALIRVAMNSRRAIDSGREDAVCPEGRWTSAS